jgi:nucleotide-binding universal stress UspA family protein
MTRAATPSRLGSERRAPAERPAREAAIREILFPSDLSLASDRAFAHAALIAERFGARTTLYHLVETTTPVGGADRPSARLEVLRRAERYAREHLARRAEALCSPAEIVVEHGGTIHDAVLRMIAARGPDLTVMSTHGRDGLARLALGSVAEIVMNLGESPVLCVREPEHGVALPYRRLLVPTDMSRASTRAFPLAGLLARSFGAGVLALHVAPRPAGDPPFRTSGVTQEIEWRMPSEAALAAFVGPGLAGVSVIPRVEIGSAWDRIVATAREERADLIVMSTHGRDSFRDLVLGSHTERVVRHASCPVLVV